MNRVLIVDDDKDLCHTLETVLGQSGFEAKSLTSIENLLSSLEGFPADLILLDYYFPAQSGGEALQILRGSDSHQRIPVIMITGEDSEDHKVEILNLGADDYVVKPIPPKELVARINAVLRRVQSSREENEPERLQIGELILDLRTHQVFHHGEELHLTLTEFRILKELVKEEGRVLSRDKLRERALGNFNVSDRTIDVHMASLRKKLSSSANSIQTVRGVGYRFAE